MRTGRPGFSDDDKATAKRLRKDGLTFVEIAKRIGRHKDAVRRLLNGGRAKRVPGCEHWWGPAHSLRYPNGMKYGTLAVCVRCRSRKYVNTEEQTMRIDPPIPRDFKGPSPSG